MIITDRKHIEHFGIKIRGAVMAEHIKKIEFTRLHRSGLLECRVTSNTEKLYLSSVSTNSPSEFGNREERKETVYQACRALFESEVLE